MQFSGLMVIVLEMNSAHLECKKKSKHLRDALFVVVKILPYMIKKLVV